MNKYFVEATLGDKEIFISKMCKIFLLSFTACFYILRAAPNETSTTENKELQTITSCIIEVSKKELYWRPTVVLKLNDNYTNFDDALIEKFREYSISYMLMEDVENWSSYVDTASFLVVGYFQDCITLATFNYHKMEKKIKYLFVLQNFSIDICSKNFPDFGSVIGKLHASLFIKTSGAQYNLYSFIPEFDPDTCEVQVRLAKQINTCVDGTLENNDIFPLKNPTNMNKCPYYIGMGSLFPFSTIQNRDSLKLNDPIERSQGRGMDFEMIDIISEYFNATVRMFFIDKREENPTVDMSYFPFMINGSYDACAGGMYRLYGDAVEYSGIYARQAILWMYYAERKTRTWQNMISSFDGLYLFLIFYLSYSVVWNIICIFDNQAVSMTDTLLYGWGALVGTSSLQDARTRKQRILNIVYLNMCLHLSVYTSIQLYSFFTIQGPPVIYRTVEELMIKSTRPPYLIPLTKYFMTDDKYVKFANTSLECTTFRNCSDESFNHKSMTVVLDSFFVNYQAETAVKDEARVLRVPENLLTVYNEMIIWKESPLVEKFQKVVQRLFEAGVCLKLFKDAVGLNVLGRSKAATDNTSTNSYSCESGCQVTLENISGLFYMWGVGCAMSCGVFLFEILSVKVAKKQV